METNSTQYRDQAIEILGDDASESEIAEMARSLEIEDAREAEEMAEAKAAEDAEFEQWKQTKETKRKVCDAILAALGIKRIEFRHTSGGSIYADFRDIKIRVSDHAQKRGGGFSLERGERMGESQVSFVCSADGWECETDDDCDSLDRAAIRSTIARAIRSTR